MRSVWYHKDEVTENWFPNIHCLFRNQYINITLINIGQYSFMDYKIPTNIEQELDQQKTITNK